MMFKARANRGAITRFTRVYPKVQHLIPTDQEQNIYKIIEKCLEPFYDQTYSVSKDQPYLLETISIIQGLDDLLDDIVKKEEEYQDVSEDIQEVFEVGVTVIKDYQSKINKNIIYYVVAVLNPQIKFNLIDE